jgi:hypothetical protein
MSCRSPNTLHHISKASKPEAQDAMWIICVIWDENIPESVSPWFRTTVKRHQLNMRSAHRRTAWDVIWRIRMRSCISSSSQSWKIKSLLFSTPQKLQPLLQTPRWLFMVLHNTHAISPSSYFPFPRYIRSQPPPLVRDQTNIDVLARR